MTTPHALAQQLAHSARQINQAISTVLATEHQHGPWHQQLDALRQSLLPTLTPAEFADMYAQTIVYNLFASRVLQETTPTAKTPSTPREQCFAPWPFNSMDTHVTSLIDDCAQLLERTDMTEVLRNFGKATMQHDPVLHFYETFLATYDPKTRDMRGVYYTPEPVVSYIVHSVDHLLQTHFNKPMGLADGNTIILDPATGTATFLHAVVQQIYAILHHMGMADAWNTYVAEKLLPRLVGFEILMAPYTIAHLKLSMLLQQLGYTLGSNERLGMYLTNALTNNKDIEPLRRQARQEHAEDNIIVILGNPPYSYASANTGEWISTLVRDYYQVDGQPLGERNPKGLQDDYVKFIRFGQWHINHTGKGILAFISNNGYLDNATFCGMRQSLLHAFDTIYILNLHGNSRKKECVPDGSPDENVFDIQQGTAIGIFIKQSRAQSQNHATVYYADLWGRRDSKYATLAAQDVQHTPWQTLSPATPWYLFIPQDTDQIKEYQSFWKIGDSMPVQSSSITTARDHLTIQWSRSDMLRVAQHFASLPPEEARAYYRIGPDARDWKVALAQADIQRHGIADSHIVPILYRPFDQRYTYYSGQTSGFLSRPRFDVMHHMLSGPNLAIATGRAGQAIQTHSVWNIIFCVQHITDLNLYRRGGNNLFPLYLYPNAHEHLGLFHSSAAANAERCNGRRPNLADAFVRDVEQRLGLTFIPDGMGNLSTTVGPEDIFHYIYAVLHSPTYRTRYADFLRIDFPRVPMIDDKAVFATLATHGAVLVDLHLLRLPGRGGVGGAGGAAILRTPSDQGITQHSVINIPIAYTRYDEQHRQIYIMHNAFFAGIAPETWGMQIGGYQPLHKWLKDRKGRMLSCDDALHYMRMVIALRETRRLMADIDAVFRG